MAYILSIAKKKNIVRGVLHWSAIISFQTIKNRMCQKSTGVQSTDVIWVIARKPIIIIISSIPLCFSAAPTS